MARALAMIVTASLAGLLPAAPAATEPRLVEDPAPPYPRRAAMRGIEGYCNLSLTVRQDGSVTDVVVFRCDPPGLFDRAAFRAADALRYEPPASGEPVTGVEHSFYFGSDDYRQRMVAERASRREEASAATHSLLADLEDAPPSEETLTRWREATETLLDASLGTADRAAFSRNAKEFLADFTEQQTRSLLQESETWEVGLTDARAGSHALREYRETFTRPMENLVRSLAAAGIDTGQPPLFDPPAEAVERHRAIILAPGTIAAFRDHLLEAARDLGDEGELARVASDLLPSRSIEEHQRYANILEEAMRTARFAGIKITRGPVSGTGPAPVELARAVFEWAERYNREQRDLWSDCLDGSAARSGNIARTNLCLVVFGSQTREAPQIGILSISKEDCREGGGRGTFVCRFGMRGSYRYGNPAVPGVLEISQVTSLELARGVTMRGIFERTDQGWFMQPTSRFE